MVQKKVCGECKEEKTICQFNKKGNHYQSYCKPCQSQYKKKHYQANRERIIAKKKRRKDNLRSWFKEYKNTLSCIECGENDSRCLDFHHVEEKKWNIADMLRYGHSKQSILIEIAKCDVVCANCHRKITHPTS